MPLTETPGESGCILFILLTSVNTIIAGLISILLINVLCSERCSGKANVYMVRKDVHLNTKSV